MTIRIYPSLVVTKVKLVYTKNQYKPTHNLGQEFVHILYARYHGSMSTHLISK
jgi:histone acetyltransferase (RNA polymerase elongator complex component)